MKKTTLLLGICLIFNLFNQEVQAASSEHSRDSILWNFDWKFQAGNIDHAWQKDFDDSQWR
ncbi:MAG: hypothetical protein J6U57_03620, partial [Bacteroidales bacterium]|nr:hypothetical protein [Bacteroidales bacterium]